MGPRVCYVNYVKPVIVAREQDRNFLARSPKIIEESRLFTDKPIERSNKRCSNENFSTNEYSNSHSKVSFLPSPLEEIVVIVYRISRWKRIILDELKASTTSVRSESIDSPFFSREDQPSRVVGVTGRDLLRSAIGEKWKRGFEPWGRTDKRDGGERRKLNRGQRRGVGSRARTSRHVNLEDRQKFCLQLQQKTCCFAENPDL